MTRETQAPSLGNTFLSFPKADDWKPLGLNLRAFIHAILPTPLSLTPLGEVSILFLKEDVQVI